MSTPALAVGSTTPDRTERAHRRTAALLTVLVHLLLVLLVMPPPPPIGTSAPRGQPDAGRIDVTLIDETVPPAPPEPAPPVRKPVAVKRPTPARAIKRAPPTPIVQTPAPLPPAAPDASDTSTVEPTAEPEPPDTPRDTAPAEAPAHVWGQPPGMRSNDAARANAALAAKLGSSRGQSSSPPPAGPDMEVDGFHVYYELVNETRLRAWRDRGMTEVFLPMPGTRRLMVCPLETALRRGSGPCRMVDFDSPQLSVIGDAREVINVQRVYQLGDEVWSGPGPYR